MISCTADCLSPNQITYNHSISSARNAGRRVLGFALSKAVQTSFMAAFFLMINDVHSQSIMHADLVRGRHVPASSQDAGLPQSVDYDVGGITIVYPVQTVLNTVQSTTGLKIDPVLANINGTGIGIADWVEVQVRIVPSSVDETPVGRQDATRVAFKAALLLTNGWIIDADTDFNAITVADDFDNAMLTFEDEGYNLATEKLYIAVLHRNHLPVMSAQSVVIDGNGIITYDFSTAADRTFGHDQEGTAPINFDVENSIYKMVSGHLNGDNRITSADRQLLLDGLHTHLVPVYHRSNLDGNEGIDGVDLNFFLFPNLRRNVITPIFY